MDDIEKFALDREAADAEEALEIRKRQVEDIVRGRQLFFSLLDELTLACDDPSMFDELESVLDQSNFEIESKIRKDKMKAIYLKVISLPARVKAFGNLTDMQAVLNRMEAQSLAVDKANPITDRMNSCLDEIGRKVRKNLDSISKPVSKEE